MQNLDEWISQKISDIAKNMAVLAKQDLGSFACGYNTGYKHALLDLEEFLWECEKLIAVENDTKDKSFLYVISYKPRGKYDND